ncbi:hypothetical protein [Candidatus Chloroploca sp. Khr17]|uniref:hypothetical protein n=1 Tax=Candidatus Chloroploca sp. Khr17 TaxID=2496869 RepID=UPI00101B5EE7|nr:hypothetical protein [Candidatus Chloroploca sp. Khr17]
MRNAHRPLLAELVEAKPASRKRTLQTAEALAHLEHQGRRLREPVERIWAGARDRAALVAGLDDQDAALIDRLLALIASPR